MAVLTIQSQELPPIPIEVEESSGQITIACETLDFQNFTLEFNNTDGRQGMMGTYNEASGDIVSITIHNVSIAPVIGVQRPDLYPTITASLEDTLSNTLTLPYTATVGATSTVDLGVRINPSVALPPCINDPEVTVTSVRVEVEFSAIASGGSQTPSNYTYTLTLNSTAQ